MEVLLDIGDLIRTVCSASWCVILLFMRWKAFFFLNPNAKNEDKNTYGFKSWRSPPTIDEMKPFEDKMKGLIANIEIKKSNNFQTSLANAIKQIQNDEKIFVKTEKNLAIFTKSN